MPLTGSTTTSCSVASATSGFSGLKVVREIEQVRAALRRAPEASVASSPKAKGVDLAGEKKARAKENKKARDEKLKGAVEEKRKAAEAPAKACAQPATVAPKNE